MKRIPLNTTGQEVSALCLGCMYFGAGVDEQTSVQLLNQYWAAGGRFLDTANCYSFWVEGCVGDESEELLGRWMKASNNRQDLFLASKVGSRPRFVGGSWPQDAQGLSAATITADIDNSLRRLQTDYIDLYYAHLDDRAAPLEETLEAFSRLVAAGKVRYIACSNIQTWRIERARQISRRHGWPAYVAVQQKYTYLRPNPGADFGGQVFASDELLDYCTANDDLTLLAYSPLLLGAYTRQDRPLPEQFRSAGTEARLAALHAVADEVGATPNQVVLAWMMQGRPAMIPVIAASTEQQLQENLGALDVQLSAEQLERLTSAGA